MVCLLDVVTIYEDTTVLTTTTVRTTTVNMVAREYTIPRITIEPLKPKGLRVLIPDEKGVISFAFHANINDRINRREEGTLYGETIKPLDGSWIFFDTNINLQYNDVIYYWVRVNYFDGNKNVLYYKENQIFVVKGNVYFLVLDKKYFIILSCFLIYKMTTLSYRTFISYLQNKHVHKKCFVMFLKL